MSTLTPLLLVLALATPALAAPIDDDDGDGLTNLDEANVTGTDPYASDTDGDGLFDGYDNDLVPTATELDGVCVLGAGGPVVTFAGCRESIDCCSILEWGTEGRAREREQRPVA